MTRYAVYYLPDPESALGRLGASWLGWDACSAESVDRSGGVRPDWVETPRHYGFHATLKPPFRLADGMSARDLRLALEDLAAGLLPVRLHRLQVTEIGGFLALTAPQARPDLGALASRCVVELDRFRAPPKEMELARRRAAGLDAAEEAHLVRWGYPYVLDRFQFHMTVTGRLDKPDRDDARKMAAAHFAPALGAETMLDALSLLEQSEAGAPFREIARFAFQPALT